jgi:adenosine deaminase
MRRSLRILLLLMIVAFSDFLHVASAAAPAAKAKSDEAAATAAFVRARENPLLLQAFLREMPKGGDLHMHLGGAVYAETLLADAATDGLCVDPESLHLVQPATGQDCAAGQVAAANVPANQALYDKLIDSFSMRGFVPSAGFDGHDQFFATFDHFRAIHDSHTGEWLAEVAGRAAAQNESYLEIMHTPDFQGVARIAAGIDWPGAAGVEDDFAALRERLLSAGLRDEVPAVRREIRNFETRRDTIDRCATSTATPGCSVRMRYLFQVLRGFPLKIVFAQTLLGFETVAAEAAAGDARYVGINFVMPEDGFLSMRDYHRHMQIIDYLHAVYPQVRISLHAGEVAPGLVPPEGLRFHIREAVELGHAERIGHGVDVMYEENPQALLAEMARRHVMVEINLTSNDVILGIRGAQHPLPDYLAAGVPVALSTDDEGVSRIDLTHEYVRAVTEFGLGYAELKQSARTSLEHSFLPGASLWAAADEFTVPVKACGAVADRPGAACSAYLARSERAAAQWDLEARLRIFEASPP